jgi:ketosteroid isomerase-like protein
MSAAWDVELVRRVWEAGQRASRTGDLDEWAAFFAEDATWEAVEDAPDAGTYRGPAGMRAYLADWLESVDNLDVEIGEIAQVGDFTVSSQKMRATVRGTDDEMVLPYSTAVRFRDGKVVHGKEFRERGDAIAYAEANSSTERG